MTAVLPYNYSGQLRRSIIQFMRIFTGFRIKTGKGANGLDTYIEVPVVYGDPSRQGSFILNNNSENTVLAPPKISCYINGLVPAWRERGGWAANIDERLVTERAFDEKTQSYTDKVGNRYRVSRMQPFPVDIEYNVDIWVSNTDQKVQLFEQICLLFNPSLDIQTSNNPLDWTSIQVVELKDVIWDHQGIPKGTGDEASVLTMTFTAQGWINPPARVRQQTLIQTIIENIGDNLADCTNSAEWGDSAPTQNIITPGNYSAQLTSNNTLTLLGPDLNIRDENNNIYSWTKLIDQLGELVPGVSKIQLNWSGDITNTTDMFVGYINYDETYDNVLDLSLIASSLPVTTLTSIIDVIDPHLSIPGGSLPAAAAGQRYIVSTNIGESEAWQGLSGAEPNDIIEFDGEVWNNVFDAATDSTVEYVINNTTGQTLKLVNHIWVDAVNNVYQPGFFQLVF